MRGHETKREGRSQATRWDQGQGRAVRLERGSKWEREGDEVGQVGRAGSWRPWRYLLFPLNFVA